MYQLLQYQGCFVMSNNTNNYYPTAWGIVKRIAQERLDYYPTAWGIVKRIAQERLVGSFLSNGLGNVVKVSCVSI